MRERATTQNHETVERHDIPDAAVSGNDNEAARDVLTDILRSGTQRLLQQAIEEEVNVWLQERSDVVDESGLAENFCDFER